MPESHHNYRNKKISKVKQHTKSKDRFYTMSISIIKIKAE